MPYDKNGCDDMFPSCNCPRMGCDLRMRLDKTAPNHVKSTGNYRYKCPDNHMRWWSITEIHNYAV